MANVNTGYGLIPVKSLGGSDVQLIECVALATYNTALFVGDPVIRAGSGDVSGRASIQIAVGGGTTTNFLGVIVGFAPQNPDSLGSHQGTAGTTRIALVYPALPHAVFRVNASGSTGANPDDIGLGFDLVSGTGSSLTGKSTWQLDMGEDANAGATTGRNCILVGFVNRADNEIGVIATDTTGIDCLVTFQESVWISGAAV